MQACSPADYTGDASGEKTGVFEGRVVSVPDLLEDPSVRKMAVLGEQTGDHWIEVDLSEQKLRAWEGDQLFLETSVSSGLPWWPTPKGEFRIWTKFRATKMEGGSGRYYYYLPNVPYVMFFEGSGAPGHKGYSLHGTYWHNDFGTQRSHGCVNLPTPIAEKLYYWTGPVVSEGKSAQRATGDNQGTRIVIHE